MQKDLDYTNIEHEACTCTRPQKSTLQSHNKSPQNISQGNETQPPPPDKHTH